VTKKRKRPEPVPPEPRSRRAVIICALATLALLGLDLGSKQWAEGTLSTERFGNPPPVCEPDEYGRVATQRVRTEEVVIIEGYLMFRYAENCGAAFGLLRDAPPVARKAVFGLAAAAASIVLFMMFVKGRGQTLFAWSVPMIVSGALGNLIDRVRYGYVVDFIRFHLQDGWEWPTFNIADCGITVGVILLVLDGFRESREEKVREAKADDKDEGSTEKAKAGESAPSGAAEQ
jgi:signal peptidase II